MNKESVWINSTKVEMSNSYNFTYLHEVFNIESRLLHAKDVYYYASIIVSYYYRTIMLLS